MTFFIGENDTAPVINGILGTLNGKNVFDNPDATSVDIGTATEVRFHMRPARSETVKVDAAATNEDAGGGDNGEVTYAWQTGDTDDTGFFFGEFEVTFSDGTVQTFPNGGSKITILISGEVA